MKLKKNCSEAASYVDLKSANPRWRKFSFMNKVLSEYRAKLGKKMGERVKTNRFVRNLRYILKANRKSCH